MATHLCLDKIATPTDENLIFMESNVDKIIWDVATEIYQQSGFKADLARVRNIVISRIENIRYQVQLKAEPKAAEQAKCEAELREQAEPKAVEEAQRLDELHKQAEQKVAEEAKRLDELQEQAEQKAAEEAKRQAELKAEIFIKLRRVLAEESGVDEEDVNLDSHLADDLGLDDTYGLYIQELAMAIGEEFEIEITDEDIEKIGFTVRELFDYLYLKINDTTEIGKLEAKRLAKLREQAERKAAEQAKCEAELREQAEQKAAEETKHLDELQKQAEQKVAEEAKRLSELQEQAERVAAEEAKRLSELKAEIFLQLRRILAEQSGVDEEDVNLDSHLADDLGLGGTYHHMLGSDVDMMELVIAIEEEFEIEIPDEEAEKIGCLHSPPTCTVGELLDYLYLKINDTTEIGKLEAKRLAKLREQAEQKSAEEAKRLVELREQAEQKAAEEAKREAELKPEIFLKLKEILVEELAVDAEQVNLDSHLADDLGADGLDGWQLSIAIENEFKIEIPDDEAEKIGLFSSYYTTNSSPNRLWLVSTSENFQPPNYHPPTCTVGELLDCIYQKINDTTKTE